MKFRNLFILNWKTFIIDIIIFFIGGYLFREFYSGACIASLGADCSQSLAAYLSLILIIISIAHFLINLVFFIIDKLKITKKQ